MAEKQNEQIVKIIQVYKDNTDDSWAQAFGFKTYAIPAWVLEKHGKLVESSNPDVLYIFEGQLLSHVKNQFGL